MDIQVDTKDGTTLFHLKGDLDLYSSPQIRNEFSKHSDSGTPKIAVDFSQVEYIDSSGLATLIELLQKLKKSSGRLCLYNINDTVLSVFELAKLDGIFRIVETESAALDEIQKT